MRLINIAGDGMKAVKRGRHAVLATVTIGVTVVVAVPATLAATSPFFDKEMAVLTDKGISPERAAQALDVQGRVAQADLVSGIEAAMGSAYAGVWFEPGAAQVHIGVTSRAGRRAAEQVVQQAGLAAVVTYTPVRSSWAALMTAQSHWNKRLVDLLASGDAMTGLDSQHSAVIITLSSSVAAEERAALKRQAATAPVNVFIEVATTSRFHAEPVAKCKKLKTFEAYCEKTLVSGVGIAPGTAEPECSAGPMLIAGNETYMLTAGHCFAKKVGEEGEVKVTVTSAYPSEVEKPEQKEIGDEGEWKYLLAKDMAVVRVKPPASSFTQALPTPVPALLAEWGKKTEEAQAVIGEAANMKGEANCRVGMTSGESCGEILRVNVSTPSGFEHLVEDTACSGGGDSGGPFFFSNSKVNNVTMQGMLVRGEKNCGETGVKTWYEPLKDEGAAGFGILSNFPGRALLTTANETRPVELPEFSVETGWTGTSGKGKLGLSGAEITCSSGTNEGKATSKKDASFTIGFKGCKLGGSQCHSLGGASEAISLGGTEHLVRLKSKDAGVWFLVTETHIECAFLSTLVEVKGNLLGLVEPILTKTTKFTINVNAKEGKQEFTEYENDKGGKEKAALEGSINGGAFKAMTEESAENRITTAKETEIAKTT